MQISEYIVILSKYWGDRERDKLNTLIKLFVDDRADFQKFFMDQHNEFLNAHLPAFEKELQELQKQKDFFEKQSAQVFAGLDGADARFLELIKKHKEEIEKINSYEKLYHEAKQELDIMTRYPQWVHWLFRKNAELKAS